MGIDTIRSRVATLARMEMGKRRRRPKQTSCGSQNTIDHASLRTRFYARLNQILDKADFDGYVESLCQRFYADEIGRPGPSSGRYFRLLPEHRAISAGRLLTLAFQI
jgi:hypothetical protein